ncbi:MAG: hypothetical protein JW882_05960 [Deltaproteobacteria bacterium]|nr:hypothetical protein [Deltaproteobacteria bacterium]
MKDVIDLGSARCGKKVKRGFRNWTNQFNEEFEISTTLSQISLKTLTFLAVGREKNSFYIYDLIMNLQDLGSGFEINELSSKEKMKVMNCYLFIIDRIRFEFMKRLGWLESYPGEEISLVELVTQFDQLAPGLQAKIPALSKDYPSYGRFRQMHLFEQEEFIRKLIPKALKEIQDYSTTL